MRRAPWSREFAGAAGMGAWAAWLALADGGYFVLGWAAPSILLVVLVSYALLRRGIGVLARPDALLIAVPLVLLAVLAATSVWWGWFSAHRAWIEAARLFVAALAVIVGATCCAHERIRRGMVAGLAASTLGIAVATCAWLATGPDSATAVLSYGKVAWPIGNSNAQAVWLLVGCWTAIGAAVASPKRRSVPVAAAAAGATSVALVLVFAADSFGAWLAAGVACMLLAWVPVGRRMVAWFVALAIVAWSVAGASVGTLHATGADATSEQAASVVPLNVELLADAATDVGRMALVAGVLGALVVPLVGLVASRLAGTHRIRRPRRAFIVTATVLAVLTTAVATASTEQGRNVARTAVSCPVPPPPDEHGFRAEVDAEYDFRCDYWRVTLDSFASRPLTGWGAGAFHGRYMLDRHGPEQPRQPHSWPLQQAGDLGIVGAALAIAFVVGILRSWWHRRRSIDAVLAAIIGATATWFAHASLDFTFDVFAVTLPVLVLLGSMAGAPRRPGPDPATTPAVASDRRVTIATLAAITIAWSLLVVPLVASSWLLRRAEDPDRSPRDAAALARDAATWEPTWARPRIVEAYALLELGESDRASDVARAAERLEPNHWTVRVAAARIHASAGRTGRANRASTAAHELNPQLDSGA